MSALELLSNNFPLFPSPASLVGGATPNINAGTIVWPAGTAVGDVGIWTSLNTNASLPLTWAGSSWLTRLAENTSWHLDVVAKKLEQSDLDTPPSWGDTNLGGASYIVLRGVTGVGIKSSVAETTTSPIVLPGFARSVHKATKCVALYADRNNAQPTGNTPVGWTHAHDGICSRAYYKWSVINPEFYDENNVSIPNVTSGSDKSAALLEIT